MRLEYYREQENDLRDVNTKYVMVDLNSEYKMVFQEHHRDGFVVCINDKKHNYHLIRLSPDDFIKTLKGITR